jgi:phospholipid/cholesterol/gamma-HCH transport system substrate-binding protein
MSRAARLGAFVITTLAVLGIGIFIIGNKQYLFTSTYRLKAQFGDVVGLNEGAEVRVGGVHRGTVSSIELPHRTSGKVTVVMDLDSSTHDIIKQDSVASIETEGLLGNEYMAISFGSAGAANVQTGDTIASHAPLAMSDLLKKTDAILDSSQEAIKNVTQTTAHLSSISAKIDQGQGTVGALINDKKLYGNLDQTMNGIRDTVAQAQVGVTDFQENMEGMKHNFFLRGYFKNRGYEDSAELAKDEIARLPQSSPLKTFTIEAKQLFAKVDTAKLKNQKSLDAAGDFLADNDFGLAVVLAYSSMEGDTEKNLVLTQGRALVVREYLVENFAFDDRQLKTLGMGKKSGTSPETGWGAIEILVYPTGTEIPPAKQPQNSSPPKSTSNQPVQESPATGSKPK